MTERIIHPFEPFCDVESRVLILGTMPSPKSRETQFFYGHPQNRFWRIMAELFDEEPLLTVPEKCRFLREHHIALWDVLGECEIKGADDSSIRNPVPADLSRVFVVSSIRAVFTNGQKAALYYRKFHQEKYALPWYALPSTSPANCRNWTYETLKAEYSRILQYL